LWVLANWKYVWGGPKGGYENVFVRGSFHGSNGGEEAECEGWKTPRGGPGGWLISLKFGKEKRAHRRGAMTGEGGQARNKGGQYGNQRGMCKLGFRKVE